MLKTNKNIFNNYLPDCTTMMAVDPSKLQHKINTYKSNVNDVLSIIKKTFVINIIKAVFLFKKLLRQHS